MNHSLEKLNKIDLFPHSIYICLKLRNNCTEENQKGDWVQINCVLYCTHRGGVAI